MNTTNPYIRSCFEMWQIPSMKGHIQKLIENEREFYNKISDKIIGEHHYKIWGHLNASIMRDSEYERYEKREEESWPRYKKEKYNEQYRLNKDRYTKAYLDIVEICDKALDFIQGLCDNKEILNPTDIITTYKSVKKACDAIDTSSFNDEYDWKSKTMPLIRILHKEYVKVIDYKRLLKFQQKANLTEEEAISIIHYLISKNLTSFYFNLDKYSENTLLVKKVMNRFSTEHSIRPEDALEVFQEYIGDGEESKIIMDPSYYKSKYYDM